MHSRALRLLLCTVPLVLALCAEPTGPAPEPSYVQDPGAPVWNNAGWKGVAGYDMATQRAVHELPPQEGSIYSLAADNGYLFAGFGDGSLRRSTTDTLAFSARVILHPDDPLPLLSLAAAQGDLWVGERSVNRGPNIYRVDPLDLSIRTTLALVPDSGFIRQMAMAANHLWVLAEPALTVFAVNLATGGLDTALELGGARGYGALAAAGEEVWALDRAGSLLHVIDPSRRSIARTVDLGEMVGENLLLGATATRFYVGEAGQAGQASRIVELSADLGSIARSWSYEGNLSIICGRGSRLIAVMAVGYNHEVIELDPLTLQVLHTIRGNDVYSYAIALE